MKGHRVVRVALTGIAGIVAPGALAMPVHVDVTLQPGKIHEECFALQRGQQVQYNFKVDQPAGFNLHYHAGKEAVYPLRSESVLEQRGNHVATVAQEYCLMWTGGKNGETRLGYEFMLVEPGLTK